MVTTSDLDIFPFVITLVVTRSLSSKIGDPVIIPVTDPSRFFFHLLSVGTPFGALTGAFFAGVTFLGAGFGF